MACSFAFCHCACLKMHWSQLFKFPLISVSAAGGFGGAVHNVGFDICQNNGDGCVSLSLPRDADQRFSHDSTATALKIYKLVKQWTLEASAGQELRKEV